MKRALITGITGQDGSRAFAEFRWRATVSLSEGLRNTINWFQEHRSARYAAR